MIKGEIVSLSKEKLCHCLAGVQSDGQMFTIFLLVCRGQLTQNENQPTNQTNKTPKSTPPPPPPPPQAFEMMSYAQRKNVKRKDNYDEGKLGLYIAHTWLRTCSPTHALSHCSQQTCSPTHAISHCSQQNMQPHSRYKPLQSTTHAAPLTL